MLGAACWECWEQPAALGSPWKDMVHVGARAAFGAETLHVELAQLLDEIVVALNVLQLAGVALQAPADTLG